ncbi:MAG: VWA domain-containing protein [Acidobacteriota bacterium]|nr:VWA domain-containing protein [Acidobacteriota bacterium]
MRLGRIVSVIELYCKSRVVAPSLGAAVVFLLAISSGSIVRAQTSPVPPPQPAPQTAKPAAPAPASTTPAAPAANSQTPSQDSQAPTIKVQANEVDLIFTVTDNRGHFIKNLNESSFGLLDNGRPPEQVFKFAQQTDLPLRVGIMLDTSSSIRGRFEFEQDSAISFLLQVLHRNDRAFVEGFDVQLDVAQPFTNNIDLLNQGVKRLRPGGGTAMFDALYSTCKDQMLTLRETSPVRKAIILVSDGDDNYSHALESDAIKECQRADTIVYAISTNVSPSKDKGDDVLQAIANATGGRAFYPTRIEDVASGFAGIEEELRSQYLLQYRPAEFKLDGAFRTIYLQANDPRYHVRAHTGYFAPKAAQ